MNQMPAADFIDYEQTFIRHLARYGPGSGAVNKFRKMVYAFYDSHRRNLPWRCTSNPYHVLVSEIMLQQTQVDRVINKYSEFISSFPDFPTLAAAPLSDLLRVWQGLGYNRRALHLQRLAQIVVDSCNGCLPSSPAELSALPGIGKATAASIAAFAFNKPTVFIETNIRSVFIHYFFQDSSGIPDAAILPLIERTLDTDNPAKWYNALMDLGSMLKSRYGNPSRRSSHHQKQSTFEGSDRQLRGKILKELSQKSILSITKLQSMLAVPLPRLHSILAKLEKDGFLNLTSKTVRLNQ